MDDAMRTLLCAFFFGEEVDTQPENSLKKPQIIFSLSQKGKRTQTNDGLVVGGLVLVERDSFGLARRVCLHASA